jgi:glycogen(starch) synthase
MKIALVSQEYPPDTARGGIGSQTFMKAKGLADRGHEVYVISQSLRHRQESKIGNITVIRINGLEHQLYHMTEIVQWITYSSMIAVELDALNQRVGLDLIDFPEWAAEGYVYLLNRTEWYGVPVVIQLHGPLVMFSHTMSWPELDSAFYRSGSHMEATCVQLADGVYSSSACSANWINKYYHPGKSYIPTIHLGIDTSVFYPRPVEKEHKPTIIFVGKLVQNKGVEELIRSAIALIPQFPDLQVWIYGKGPETFTQLLVELVEESDVTQNIHFKGFITKDELPDALSRAHIFAGPSYYEGGPGFVYLEAMACGLPVVACSGSGVSEVVEHGYNGLLVPPANTVALEEALRSLLLDRSKLELLGSNAFEYVRKEADLESCLNRLEAFYNRVIASKELSRSMHMAE